MATFDSGAFDSGAFDTGGGSGTNVAPGAASVTITGIAPAVTQSANQNVAPGAASLTIAGYAPTVAQSSASSIAPGAASLTITGLAPVVAQSANQSVSPDVGALSIAGYAPTVTQVLASPNLMLGATALTITGYAPDVTQADPSAVISSGHGFEMVSMEPSWKRALRLRAESKQKVELGRKQRKRAEFIEKLAAKEALSTKSDTQIERRIESLLSEWVDLAPKLELKPVAELPHADAYRAFMARVAEHIRRLEEDDETAAEMLLLM